MDFELESGEKSEARLQRIHGVVIVPALESGRPVIESQLCRVLAVNSQ